MAMTLGYVLVDRTVAARHDADCGGSSGLAPSALRRKEEAVHGTSASPRPQP